MSVNINIIKNNNNNDEFEGKKKLDSLPHHTKRMKKVYQRIILRGIMPSKILPRKGEFIWSNCYVYIVYYACQSIQNF